MCPQARRLLHRLQPCSEEGDGDRPQKPAAAQNRNRIRGWWGDTPKLRLVLVLVHNLVIDVVLGR
ncbi:MAG: hypothetical protein ACKPKO_10945, partial [Candidatus Fonsibacter sp.]